MALAAGYVGYVSASSVRCKWNCELSGTTVMTSQVALRYKTSKLQTFILYIQL